MKKKQGDYWGYEVGIVEEKEMARMVLEEEAAAAMELNQELVGKEAVVMGLMVGLMVEAEMGWESVVLGLPVVAEMGWG